MVSTSKKLSVIIPVYNEEGTVTALLDKVVQAVISTSLEIIIVNDGSTDGSPALIEKWVQEHRKSRAEILYLTKKKRGQGLRRQNRNQGFDRRCRHYSGRRSGI